MNMQFIASGELSQLTPRGKGGPRGAADYVICQKASSSRQSKQTINKIGTNLTLGNRNWLKYRYGCTVYINLTKQIEAIKVINYMLIIPMRL